MREESNRSDAWSNAEDEVVAKIVCRFIRENRTQLDAFKQASYRTGRTPAAVGYRWNRVLRDKFAEHLERAKLIRAHNKRGYLTPLEETVPDGAFQDTRYVSPKEEPRASSDRVDEAIASNEIYSMIAQEMELAQRRQIAYGLDKYVETLNPNSWSVVETIDHIISETVDKLHYLAMLKIKLIQEIERADD